MRYYNIKGMPPVSRKGVLWKNLSPDDIVTRCTEAPENELRALAVGDDNYYWPAIVRTHGDAALIINNSEYDYIDNRFWVYIVDGECRITWPDNFPYGKGMNRAFRRLLPSPLLLFDGGSEGWISGENFEGPEQ